MFLKWEKWLILVGIIIALSVDLLDMTIVNVAIPKFMAVFGVDVNHVQWVATAYMMTIGVVIPITAYLADTFGTKRIFITSLILFTAGSVLCGLAWSMNALIFFRIIQGLGGGMIMPLGISIIYNTFSEAERGLVMGIMGLPLLAAPAIGPVLGGYLVEHADWRWIFFINIPVGILASLLLLLVLKEFEKHRPALDFPGFIFSAAGLASLLLALSKGPVDGWDEPYIVFLLIISIFLLIVFVLWELEHSQPLLELRLFANPVFCFSMVLSVLSIMAIMGSLFLLPVFLQDLRGYGPVKTGLLLAPEALAAAITLPVSGLLVNRLNPAFLSVPGMVLVIYSTWRLTQLELQTGNATLTGLLVVLGAGMGLGVMPAITVGLNAVPPRLTGQGSSLLNMIRQVGSSFSIAVLSSVLQTRQDLHYAHIADHVTVDSPAIGAFLHQLAIQFQHQGFPGQSSTAMAISILQKQAGLLAAVMAFHDAFLIATVFAVLGLIPALVFLVLKTPPAPGKSHDSKGLHFH
ncbi:MAG: DHA2 family efflux MFS transporter permease subunit [Bacillota bacterium]